MEIDPASPFPDSNQTAVSPSFLRHVFSVQLNRTSPSTALPEAKAQVKQQKRAKKRPLRTLITRLGPNGPNLGVLMNW